MARDINERVPLRAHMTWNYYSLINNQKTLHIDAWIKQDANDILYFVIVSTRGGYSVFDEQVLRVEPIGDNDWHLVPTGISLRKADEMLNRYCNNAWARKHAPYLNMLHQRYVAGSIRASRDGFKGSPSVRLHYVWSDPAINDPMEGITNLYGMTARCARDESMTKAKPVAAPEPAPTIPVKPERVPRLNQRDRSVMRTLDKLLQPERYYRGRLLPNGERMPTASSDPWLDNLLKR